MKLRLTALWAILLALVTCLTVVPVALAGTTSWAGAKTSMRTVCDNQVYEQPFVQFGDSGSYVFAPNGGFEGGKAGWTLSGAAGVVSGNEPFYVHGKTDKNALSLPAGATATSPAICMGLMYPWSRLFVNGQSGASLKVELLYVDNGGVARSMTIATLGGAGSWQLSPQLLAPSFLISTYSALGSTSESGERYSAVAYRFTAAGGTWKLDDLYVDPFKFG